MRVINDNFIWYFCFHVKSKSNGLKKIRLKIFSKLWNCIWRSYQMGVINIIKHCRLRKVKCAGANGEEIDTHKLNKHLRMTF
jgi:hypothetical protein